LPGVKNNQMPNFIKISPFGTDLFHAGRETDRHEQSDSRYLKICERAKQFVQPYSNSHCVQLKFVCAADSSWFFTVS
jgi:hypothetical protein